MHRLRISLPAAGCYFFALLLITIAISQPLARAASDTTFQQTLRVTSAPTVVVHTQSGSIHVALGASNQITIVGKIHFTPWGWDSAEGKAVQAMVQHPPIRQTGNRIQIGEQDNGTQNHTTFSGGTSSPGDHHFSIDYEITVPNGTDLQTTSDSGNLQVQGIQGPLTATTGSGDITASDLVKNSTLTTGSGNIHARAVGDVAKMTTGSGDIQITQSSITDLQAQTGSGNIHVNAVQGHLRAVTGSGDITIQGSPAKQGMPKSTPSLKATPSADWQITAGSGNIDLTLPATAKFLLDANSGSGGIQSDLPITQPANSTPVHTLGVVNGGGSTLRLETSSGQIRLHAQHSPPQ